MGSDFNWNRKKTNLNKGAGGNEWSGRRTGKNKLPPSHPWRKMNETKARARTKGQPVKGGKLGGKAPYQSPQGNKNGSRGGGRGGGQHGNAERFSFAAKIDPQQSNKSKAANARKGAK